MDGTKRYYRKNDTADEATADSDNGLVNTRHPKNIRPGFEAGSVRNFIQPRERRVDGRDRVPPDAVPRAL
jgi:hypothetical protein